MWVMRIEEALLREFSSKHITLFYYLQFRPPVFGRAYSKRGVSCTITTKNDKIGHAKTTSFWRLRDNTGIKPKGIPLLLTT